MRVWLGSVIAFLLVAEAARADVMRDRFGAGGYFRIMTRPDFQGGDSRLGFSNLYGRLLNEGPYGALELKLDIVPRDTVEVWTSVTARIEGDSFFAADGNLGSLGRYRVTQMYVQAGNILFPNVIWQLGTLDYWLGEIGLYDLRPARVFQDTVGLSARYWTGDFEVLVGAGDAGYALRGANYSTVLTAGGLIRSRPKKWLELGLGGQAYYEPKVVGNRNAPHQTPLPEGTTYEDVLRRRVLRAYDLLYPNSLDEFPNPEPTSNTAGKVFAYLGFGDLGPLRWNSLYLGYEHRMPDTFYLETLTSSDVARTLPIYIADLTDERTSLFVGDEMMLRIWPERVDAIVSGIFGVERNGDNEIASGEDNRRYFSVLTRIQTYLTREVHLLFETSFARETSLNGLLWREHHDSVFANDGDGVSNSDGLQFGDTDRRNTLQLKGGLVLSPLGRGIYTRPSIRLLYGAQYSNVNNSFGNNFSRSLDENEVFRATQDRHWHQVVALEAEAWF